MKLIKLVCAATVMSFASIASADPAEVLHDSGCLQLDSNGALLISDTDMTVHANSENGNITFKCKSEGVFNDTGKRLVFDFDNTGFTCSGQTNWQQVLTPSGNAITRCHAKF